MKRTIVKAELETGKLYSHELLSRDFYVTGKDIDYYIGYWVTKSTRLAVSKNPDMISKIAVKPSEWIEVALQ